MVDSISIVQKKTTRPSRDGKTNKPEIQEGMSREEVEKCEWTYEFAGNLYGIFKEEIDEILKTGNAILIVNDPSMQVMEELKEVYPKNFLQVIVYQDMDRQKWIDDMRQANRTEKEIETRMETFGISQRIYFKSCLPEVVFNMSERQNSYKAIKTIKWSNK